MTIRWVPSLGSIFATSSMITLFLGIFVFLTCYMHASSSASLPQINAMITQLTGSSNDNLGVLGLTLLEAQIWVPEAAFSTSINFMDIDLPPFFLYYILAFSAGFAAAIIGLRKNSRIIDSLISPLISALYIILGMVVLGFIVQAVLGSFTGAMAGAQLNLGLDASGYVLIFLINWCFFTLGAFSAAGLKQLIHSMWKDTPSTAPRKTVTPVKTQPKPVQKPQPVVKKPVPKAAAKPVPKPQPKPVAKPIPKTPAKKTKWI